MSCDKPITLCQVELTLIQRKTISMFKILVICVGFPLHLIANKGRCDYCNLIIQFLSKYDLKFIGHGVLAS
jgi:hypothetical protein